MDTAKSKEEKVISCEDKIADFKKYMDSNQRCILSAGFGDGKSYFLNKFMEATGDQYIYIPIYPVNYQVADNRDIFEYIKRDIVIELLGHGEEYISNGNFNKLLLLQSYLINRPGEVFENVADSFPSITIGCGGIGSFKIEPVKIVKGLKKLRADFEKYAKSFCDKKRLEDFLSSFDNKTGGIYELDPISQLICDINDNLRRELSKKIVLVIEDLDRIDPAHIFRILNIFSAHFDGNVSSEDGSNKFRFDKIILVCDYDNIQKIYRHFYGSETCFRGYISKFSVSQPFRYSLGKEYAKYISQILDPEISQYPLLTAVLAELIIRAKGLKESSLREIRNKLQQPYLIRDENIALHDNRTISSINRFVKLLDILRRFDIEFEDLYNHKGELVSMDIAKIEEYRLELLHIVDICWFIVGEACENIGIHCLEKSDQILLITRKFGGSQERTRLDWRVKATESAIEYVDLRTIQYWSDSSKTRLFVTIPNIATYMKRFLINHTA